MDESIKSICVALGEEAEAVISYSEKIAALGNNEATKDTAMKLHEIMLDEIEHIQKLTLELTRVVTSEPGGEGTNSGSDAE